MTEPLRMGIIGLGKQGGIRARTVREHDDAVLISGTDPAPPAKGFDDLEILAGLRGRHRLGRGRGVRLHAQPFHPRGGLRGARRRQARVLREAARPHGGRHRADHRLPSDATPASTLKFGFNHRYHFGIMEAKKIVESGKYGDVLWVRGVYGKAEYSAYPTAWRCDPTLAGGGILLDQGIHMLDLFRHFCGEFTEIKSMLRTPSPDDPLEDNAFALLRTAEGRIAMIHSSSTQWKHRFTLEIYLEDGYVIVDGQPSTSRSFRDEWLIESRKGLGFAVGNPPEQATFCNTDPSWELELAEFVDCIRTGQPVRNGTSTDALETMRLVLGIYEADEPSRSSAPS